ncbi:MAG TPA: ROK family protein [Verrucomicrobiae bacterium]|nr:ROK family protein [Verrucomicrobiae bacterium]
MSTALSNQISGPVPFSPCFVGVDVGPMVIRAEMYSGTFDLLGKMKLSAKPERGLASTVERIERCVRYVADECDLSMASIDAIGVGLPGVVDASGHVTLEHGFGLRGVRLRRELEARLARPVHVGNIFELACHAIQVLESSHDSGDFGVLFPGAILAAGLVLNGKPVDLSRFPLEEPLLPPDAGNVVKWTEDPRFRGFRARDFRKAIRKGDEHALRFLRQSMGEAAVFGARLVQNAGVRQLVFGGGATDENKAEMVAEAKSALAAALARQDKVDPDLIKLTTSELGDSAGMTGAALMAAQSNLLKEQSDVPPMGRRLVLAR